MLCLRLQQWPEMLSSAPLNSNHEAQTRLSAQSPREMAALHTSLMSLRAQQTCAAERIQYGCWWLAPNIAMKHVHSLRTVTNICAEARHYATQRP